MHVGRRPGLALALLLSLGTALHAAGSPAAAETTVRVAASERYERGRAHRFVFGGDYRDLWRAKVELPVLDLQSEGGGLTAWRRFGGQQTAVLAFQGADGRSYTFRGTDKDPSKVLDPELHDTIVEDVVQDQMAAQHPGGALVVSVLAEHAGLRAPRERMVVMPDDPALGAFRDEFAGMVGNFYEFPMPASDRHDGFHGATSIIDHEELGERLRRGRDDAVEVDAFLRARLFDLLIGDFDRHRKQWRWGRFPDSDAWSPIPEDRDMAFVRYDGIALRVAAVYLPILQRYGPEYPAMKGLTLHGWEQDRWLLAGLSWPTWEQLAGDLQRRITDDAIDAAVRAMPPEYVALDGERLGEALRGRRDRLARGARLFYLHLARQVDVHLSDQREDVRVERRSDGSMRVRVERRDAGVPARASFDRVFHPDETSDVRVYLRNGEDRVRILGPPGGIRLRMITGEGPSHVDDSVGGGTRIHASQGDVEVVAGDGTVIDERPYEAPKEQPTFTDVEDLPPRDWGSDTVPLPLLGFENDVGAFAGVALLHTRYGFRKHPWSSRHRLSVGWATKADRASASYEGVFRSENSTWRREIELSYSGTEVLRFFGFGNETDGLGDPGDAFFRVRNSQFRAAPRVAWHTRDNRVRLSGGPWLQYTRTRPGDRLIDQLEPYGSGRFGSLGVAASFEYDTRIALSDHANLAMSQRINEAAGYPTEGVFVRIDSVVSPALWDVERTWGAVEGSVAGYASLGEKARATLGGRVGGRHTFGRVPYYAAAYVGGGSFFSGSAVVRGFRAQRFAGDSSVFANLDLRVFLGRTKIVVPCDVGVLAFGDVGRVFLDGESSRVWHPSWGGGVWVAPLARTNTLSVSVAGSPEDTIVYARIGFHY